MSSLNSKRIDNDQSVVADYFNRISSVQAASISGQIDHPKTSSSTGYATANNEYTKKFRTSGSMVGASRFGSEAPKITGDRTVAALNFLNDPSIDPKVKGGVLARMIKNAFPNKE